MLSHSLDTYERSLLSCFALLAPIGRLPPPLDLAELLANAEPMTGIPADRVATLLGSLERKGFVAVANGVLELPEPRQFWLTSRRGGCASSATEQVAEKGRSASLLPHTLVRRSSATPPRSFGRASHLDLFEQPAGGASCAWWDSLRSSLISKIL